MTPTMELRFVMRQVTEVPGQPYKIMRVLQQKWLNLEGRLPAMEWRDVQMGKEEETPVHKIDGADWPEPDSGFAKLEAL